jgi:hypothetical protein
MVRPPSQETEEVTFAQVAEGCQELYNKYGFRISVQLDKLFYLDPDPALSSISDLDMDLAGFQKVFSPPNFTYIGPPKRFLSTKKTNYIIKIMKSLNAACL